MKKLLFALALLLASPALADSYGNGIIPVGATKQVSGTTTSSNVTLGAISDYVLVMNEGTIFAYVTCTSTVATVPGGTANTSTPVPPNGGGLILNATGYTPLVCAAITASGTASVDFTPVNLF